MTKIKTVRICLFVIALNCPAITDAAQNGAVWSGEVEIGFVKTGGNTDTQALNSKAKVQYETKTWRNSAALEAVNIADSGTTTAERYVLGGSSKWKFSGRAYAFANGNYESDRFSGFDYQSSEALGLGYRILAREALSFDFEGGPGARQSKEDQGDNANELIMLLGAMVDWKISPTASFNQSLASESGNRFTRVKSVSAIKSQIIGSLAMKASLTLRHNTEAPAASKKTDSETALTVVYQF